MRPQPQLAEGLVQQPLVLAGSADANVEPAARELADDRRELDRLGAGADHDHDPPPRWSVHLECPETVQYKAPYGLGTSTSRGRTGRPEITRGPSMRSAIS